MNDKKITIEISDRQLAAILAANYCLRSCSKQAQCRGLFIENIRDEKSHRITFVDAIEVLDELLDDIVPRMDGEQEAETMTNNELINRMSIEDKVAFFFRISDDCCRFCVEYSVDRYGNRNRCSGRCREGVRMMLESEAVDDDL